MKYWRGYLTAAIFALFTWALMQFAGSHRDLVDMVYPYVTRMLQTFLAEWSSGVSFCLWQLIAVALGVGLIASVVLMVILRWNPIQWFGWVLATASMLFMIHTAMYGLNTYAGPLAEDVRLPVTEYTVADLEEATLYYRDQANALARQIPRDAAQAPQYPTFAQLAEKVGEGFHTLTYRDYNPIFAGSTLPVKELGWADTYTSMGIAGVTMYFTGEAAVNPQIPVVSMPFTMCHEMAHRMCIANEGDANFAAFLACRVNESPEIQYSAYFMAFRYCYNALASVSSAEASAAATRVVQGIDPLLLRDLDSYREFFAAKQDKKATQLADKANDTYIKVSGDDKGLASYGQVCDLLVNWHLQQIVIPNLVVDEDNTFDPFDRDQVDLSGLPNAG